ncbi:MAG: hypothetical protein J7K81_06985 [Methanophagales archaeon]|nr:hypothetical protein [Methanophagales archaeon]
MNEYKIKTRDTAKVEKLQEVSYQIPILQTREELIDFLIRNKAYPYYSKTGKIFFRRLKKAETFIVGIFPESKLSIKLKNVF